jgi:hypothetical protein
MPDPVNPPELTTQIRFQLEDVGRRIDKLVALQDGLRRVLVQLTGQAGGSTKPRSNGTNRLMIETRILEALVAAQGQPVPTHELFECVRVANPQLKYSTFRAHLSRFKKRGVITAATRLHGYWQLEI